MSPPFIIIVIIIGDNYKSVNHVFNCQGTNSGNLSRNGLEIFVLNYKCRLCVCQRKTFDKLFAKWKIGDSTKQIQFNNINMENEKQSYRSGEDFI